MNKTGEDAERQEWTRKSCPLQEWTRVDKEKLDGSRNVTAGQNRTVRDETGKERTYEDCATHKTGGGTEGREWTRKFCPLLEGTRVDKKKVDGRESVTPVQGRSVWDKTNSPCAQTFRLLHPIRQRVLRTRRAPLKTSEKGMN